MGNWKVCVRVLVTFFCVSIALTAGDWNYENADSWKNYYPSCDEMNLYQSPIRLSNMFPDQLDYTLELIGSSKEIKGEVTNAGKFLDINLNLKPQRPTPSMDLRIGDERSEYFITGIEFHWPAEHIINGKRYDLEMQVQYKDYETDKIMIVSTLYKVCEESEFSGMKKMEKVLKGFSKSPEIGDIKFNLAEFSDLDCGMYMYNGSLTTPPCTVGVTWVVYDEALCISEDELAAFKNLKDRDGQNIKPNNRPPFSERGRKVYYTPC